MGQNPLAVLAAMLGGGFQGYAQDQQTRKANEDRDRQFNLQYDQFKANNELARDEYGLNVRRTDMDETERDRRFGLDKTETDRRFGLDTRRTDHGMQYDWARLFQEAQEAARDRASQTQNTRINAFGRQDRDEQTKEQTGLAWLTANRSNPAAMKAIQGVFQGAPELAKRPGLAAYYAQVGLANQGKMENVDSRTQNTQAQTDRIQSRTGVNGIPSWNSTTQDPQGGGSPPPSPPQRTYTDQERADRWEALVRSGMSKDAATQQVNREMP